MRSRTVLYLPHLQAALIAVLVAAADPAGAGALLRPAQSAPEADARAQQLDALFNRLKAAGAQAEGDEIVAEIWKLWQQSGDRELDGLMNRAILAMSQGIPVLALPLLDDVVKRRPDWAEGWNKRATVLYMLGEYDRSLADIERVLALEPRHFGALAGMGLIHIARGRHREALAVYRRALTINPFLRERHSIMPALEREIGEKPL
ncbi:MAG: tetratricopeptide repeat protein [Hyphomicrobiaceae bacterium]|nr:MAG: tetratricopeptide repeat protein [Hyphomicrobiaceae bacterium]